MFKKYISKFTIDILPSIMATIVGAYIVNHYIVPKNDADKPAAAMASVPDPKADPKAAAKPDSKAAAKATAKPIENSSELANVPDAAARAKADKPAVEKASLEKPETASVPADTRRHQPASRDKAAKAAPASAPVIANVAPAAELPAAAEERRDANDLARAAIERLRSVKEAQPAPQEAARAPEAPRAQDMSRAALAPPTASLQQLPPPIMVSTPSTETYGSAASRSPSEPAERGGDSQRPRPPGEIPVPPPLDLQADMMPPNRRERTNVAEDVLSAARSVFHSVIPHPFER
jgi:hypothetical protein